MGVVTRRAVTDASMVKCSACKQIVAALATKSPAVTAWKAGRFVNFLAFSFVCLQLIFS